MTTPLAIPSEDADDKTFEAAIASRAGELVLVEFWGHDCPNCVVFERELPALTESLRGERVRMVRVNAYENPEVATRFGVFGIPAFFLFRDGRKLGRMSEFRGRSFFLGVIRDHLPTEA